MYDVEYIPGLVPGRGWGRVVGPGGRAATQPFGGLCELFDNSPMDIGLLCIYKII